MHFAELALSMYLCLQDRGGARVSPSGAAPPQDMGASVLLLVPRSFVFGRFPFSFFYLKKRQRPPAAPPWEHGGNNMPAAIPEWAWRECADAAERREATGQEAPTTLKNVAARSPQHSAGVTWL